MLAVLATACIGLAVVASQQREVATPTGGATVDEWQAGWNYAYQTDLYDAGRLLGGQGMYVDCCGDALNGFGVYPPVRTTDAAAWTSGCVDYLASTDGGNLYDESPPSPPFD